MTRALYKEEGSVDAKGAMWIGILFIPFVLMVIVTLVERLRAGRCPQCGRWRVRASGPLYPHGPRGDRQATTFYRCQRCGFTWSKVDE